MTLKNTERARRCLCRQGTQSIIVKGYKPLRKAFHIALIRRRHPPWNQTCGRACREGGFPKLAQPHLGLSEGDLNRERWREIDSSVRRYRRVGIAGFQQVKRVFLPVRGSWEEGPGSDCSTSEVRLSLLLVAST